MIYILIPESLDSGLAERHKIMQTETDFLICYVKETGDLHMCKTKHRLKTTNEEEAIK